MLSFLYINSFNFLDPGYVGCFQDHRHRTLPHKVSDVHGVAECVQKCKGRVYKYAGLQVSKFFQVYFMISFDHLLSLSRK